MLEIVNPEVIIDDYDVSLYYECLIQLPFEVKMEKFRNDVEILKQDIIIKETNNEIKRLIGGLNGS